MDNTQRLGRSKFCLKMTSWDKMCYLPGSQALVGDVPMVHHHGPGAHYCRPSIIQAMLTHHTRSSARTGKASWKPENPKGDIITNIHQLQKQQITQKCSGLPMLAMPWCLAAKWLAGFCCFAEFRKDGGHQGRVHGMWNAQPQLNAINATGFRPWLAERWSISCRSLLECLRLSYSAQGETTT